MSYVLYDVEAFPESNSWDVVVRSKGTGLNLRPKVRVAMVGHWLPSSGPGIMRLRKHGLNLQISY